MKSKYIHRVGWLLGVTAMLLGSALFAEAASSSVKAGDESQKAVRLFRDIKADAVEIRSAAMRLDRLTASADAKWLDYDRQWNEIKPAVEDMQMKLRRLETMQAEIAPNERTELDQSKLLIEEIQSRTRQLRTLLDIPGVQTTDAKFKAYARSLHREAGRLEKTASVS